MYNNKFFILSAINVIVFLMAAFAIFYTYSSNQKNTLSIEPIVQNQQHNLNTQNLIQRDVTLAALPSKNGDIIPSLAPILEDTTPAIVNISTIGKVTVNNNSPFFENPFFQDPFFERFFKFNTPRSPIQKETQSIGSGVIVDKAKGYILTNHHVVKNAEKIYVTLLDKTRLEAKLVGSDTETDIAVLQVKEKLLTEVPLGKSDNLEVGDFVIAIGNPFGLGHTVTSGIVSALGRSGLGIEGYEDFIQTDASINPGNSGGALINLKGELIGINTAILSKSGGNVGIGFAIPIDMANSVLTQLIKYGEVKRGQLGVQIQDIKPDTIEIMSLDIKKGVLVVAVSKNSPAEKAGIKAGDIIISLNGDEVSGASDLKNKVGTLRVGEKTNIKILREGKYKNITAKIGKMESNDFSNSSSEESEIELLKGASFQTHAKGVLIENVTNNSPAYRAGLRKGDIVFSVNKQKVTTPSELFKAAKQNEKGIMLRLIRGGSVMFIVIH